LEAVRRKFLHRSGNPATVGVVRWPSAGDTAGYRLRRSKLTPVSVRTALDLCQFVRITQRMRIYKLIPRNVLLLHFAPPRVYIAKHKMWPVVTPWRSIVVTACLSVCVSVCPRAYLRNCTFDLRQISVHVTDVRVSVLLWRRCDALCTSGGYG